MSEQVEFWRQQREYERQEGNETAKDVTELLANLSEQYPFVCETMQGFIRLHHQHKRFRIDIYPKSGKYHIINSGERGVCRDYQIFIKEQFNE